MLTSPMAVTSTTTGGTALKAHAAPPDAGTRKEQAHFAAGNQAIAGEALVSPELPSHSPLTSVNAVAATVGARTILQNLSLNVAAALKMTRGPDETLTALFIRIIAAIDAMPQSERLQVEIRSGLKNLKITLPDLAAALRKPDGPEAARLTAMVEAPAALPGRASVTAATSTYLQEGTADGHMEETLAMRAAARNSAAGQSLFSPETRTRPIDSRPANGRVLQDQLKSMFEPGAGRNDAATGHVADRSPPTTVAGSVRDDLVVREESRSNPQAGKFPADIAPGEEPIRQEPALDGRRTVSGDGSRTPVAIIRQGEYPARDGQEIGLAENTVAAEAEPMVAEPDTGEAALSPEDRPSEPRALASNGSGKVVISTANLRLDPPAVERIRVFAQAIADGSVETANADTQRPPAEKATAVADRRPPAMLTLKGLVEVVTALPAKTAEILAGIPLDRAMLLPKAVAGADRLPARTMSADPQESREPDLPKIRDERMPQSAVRADRTDGTPAGAASREMPAGRAAPQAKSDDAPAAILERSLPARPDLAQHAVPFAYAQIQPAPDEGVEGAEDDRSRDEAEDDDGEEHEESEEKRRPRDEYDAIHDPAPEEDGGLVITRDSSESDRAFALYQRMGGF
ncbi:MAG: hypothetical protein KDJ87_16900 [Rhizobiaceae bacterium]|nr:hypothetical protein [Rhizobiaceae bacterium]